MDLANLEVSQGVGIRMLRVLICLSLVAAITWIAFSVLHVNALVVGFTYVLAVLVVAARWGLAESIAISVAAMLCLNYFFLPPILSLTIADPQNWVALFVFVVTALTASALFKCPESSRRSQGPRNRSGASLSTELVANAGR
jgi:K+-sensing histidine kinase KdpD